MEPVHVFTGDEIREELEDLAQSGNRLTRRRAATRLKGPPSPAAVTKSAT